MEKVNSIVMERSETQVSDLFKVSQISIRNYPDMLVEMKEKL